jgi:choline dehydrogenase-like flavoprotein
MTRLATAGALLQVQLLHLTDGGQPLIDDPAAGAAEMLQFLAVVPQALADLLGSTLDELEGHGLLGMSPADRENLLKRLWGDPLWRGRLSMLIRLGWLVLYSRPAARKAVGFCDPREFPHRVPPVDVPQPPVPPLDNHYDVCIVGSGAGAAVVAARLAEAGKRVLMVERGQWVSPADLPTRDDEALRRLFQHGGVNPAVAGEIRAFIEVCRNQLGTINVLQAGVVGGGPYVNNAILLPMAQSAWQVWRDKFGFPIDWKPLEERMALVARDLGSTPPGSAAGERSLLFRRGAAQSGRPSADLPLAVYQCVGCGGCNVCCRFGRKTGGLHGNRPAGAPLSYLHRALGAGTPAAIRPQLEAVKFKSSGWFSKRVDALVARDLSAGGKEVQVRARAFVLAAGPIASSQVLGRTLHEPDYPPGLGIAANVVMPVFALTNAPLGGDIDPGIQMCYFVDAGGGVLLESWFHYPASLAIALPGWLDEHAATMRSYGQLASAGVVVPTKPSGRLGLVTDIVLGLDHDELERMKRGVVELAALYLATNEVDQVIPSTADPLPIRRDHKDEDIARFKNQVTTPAQLNLGTAHPQGGNRIGKSSGSSVVDASFRVHGIPNLFVTDASVFPAGCGVNPQLTVMALASLAADEILRSLG